VQSATSTAQDAVRSSSQQGRSLAEGVKEQAGGAYTKAVETAQSVSSTAQAQASKASDAAQSVTLTAHDTASGSYTKATDATESVASTARGKASEVYNKYTQAADSPTSSAQATNAGSQSDSLIERGKEVANNAQEQSRDIADTYGKKE
jgi:hypothetical protein